MDEDKVKIKKDVLSIGATNVLVNLLAIITTIMVARSLGPAGQGLVAVVITTVDTFTKFMGLGTQASALYYINSGKIEAKKVIENVFGFAALLSVLGAIFLALTYRPDFSNSSISVPSNLFLTLFVAFYLIACFVRGNLHGLLISIQQYPLYNRLNFINSALPLLLMVWPFFQLSLNVGTVLSVYLITNIVGLTIIYFTLNKINGGLKPRLEKNVLKEFFSYGLLNYFNNLLIFFEQRFTIVAIGFFFGLPAAGLYSIAYSLAEKINEISNPVSTVHFPKVTQLQAMSIEKALSFTSSIFSRLAAAFMVVIVPFGLAIWFLLPLFFSDQYSASRIPAIILSLFFVSTSLSKLLNNFLSAIKEQQRVSYFLMIGLALDIIGLAIVRVFNLDWRFFVIAITIAYSVILLTQLIYLGRRFHFKLSNFRPKVITLTRELLAKQL